MVDTLVSKYRQLHDGDLVSQRSSYVNDVDQLAAIQLSFLMVQKQFSLDGTLSGKQLFELQKKINSNKLAVPNSPSTSCTPSTSGILDIVPFDDVYSSYVSFKEHCNIIDNADVRLFLNSKLDHNKDIEMNKINDEIDGQILSSPRPRITTAISSPLGQIPKNHGVFSPSIQSPQNATTVCSPFAQSPKNSSNLQLRRIIISYLQLIVNSRNEIALARIIDIPTRGIDHKSFTDIRKFALEKGMPMYQVISSFSRQILLGGKGYAPNEHHTLFEHKEGLLEFMDLMDKLQTIVDEGESIGCVLIALLKLLKTAFVRAKHPVFSPKTVSLVIQELLNIIKSQFLKKGNDRKSEMCLLLRDFVDFISCIAGNEIAPSSSQLCGILATPEVSSTTFKKITTLVTNFTTPGICEETPKKSKNITLCGDNRENLDYVGGGVKKTPVSSKIGNQDDEDDEETDIGSITPLSDPVKLIRCPVAKDQNEKGTISNILTKERQSVVSKVQNKEKKVVKKECPPVKRRAVASKEKSKCAKKIKLLSGQKTLSQFFSK